MVRTASSRSPTTVPASPPSTSIASSTASTGSRWVASGSGLGLAIARELAGRMGGTLEVRSQPAQTVFTLRLEAAAVPARARNCSQAEPLAFSRESAATVRGMRRGPLAALLGAAALLGGAVAAGLVSVLDRDDRQSSRPLWCLCPSPRRRSTERRARLRRCSATASTLPRSMPRGRGVVTIYAEIAGGQSQGSGFVVDETGRFSPTRT